MATYAYEKVLADYASGRMDVEMALGHTLQHIGQLYSTQSSVTTEQHAMHKAIQTLEGDLRTLQASFERWQKAQTERLQTVENNLSALLQSMAASQATGRLTAPKPGTTHPKSRADV